jgi:hypothetical protein
MTSLLHQLQQSRVDWETTRESPYIFQAVFREKVVLLRLNDFPEEPLCTVIIGATETDLQDFPKTWTLPRHRGEQQ